MDVLVGALTQVPTNTNANTSAKNVVLDMIFDIVGSDLTADWDKLG